ncbi:uncharacterized protein LOC127701894 [Mytilus californianus]|uniref:uncharacterized protein LOC127701894 n=1 Tax=Mytilus californianus TaxID=6549 RepID=UPI0022460909|nr:uncharacterized protein LOC127701894 [Mytilus californianus]
MEYLGLLCILMVLTTVPIVTYAGNSRHFVTENCGHVVGPDYGAYLEFDRAATFKKGVVGIPYALKGQEFECIIVVRGMPSTGEKRFMAIHFRQFHLKEQAVVRPENEVAKCGKAYMIIYNGMDRNAAEKYVFCGKDAVIQNLEWKGEYMTFYFYIDYRNPDFSTVDPLVSLPPATGNTTLSPPTTTPDPFPYPTVFFKMDITSYDFECNETIDKVSLKCNDSKRCLDDSLKCDFWFSRNCASDVYPRDNTDVSRQAPANCFRKPTTTTTTTTLAPPPFRPDLTPLYAAVGGVLGVALLLWCCWKPAYLPWRLGRCRNYPCWVKCGNLCPCLKCRACFPGPSTMSPTGAASWKAARLQRGSLISQDMSEFSPLGLPGPYSVSGYPDSLHGSPRKSIKSGQVAPFPNGRGSIPNGVPTTPGSFEQRLAQPFDFYPRTYAKNVSNAPPNPQVDLDSMNLANNWMRLLSADGSHLREQR